MIHLAKDWLLSFLPHALSKINRVHYGLVHDDDIERWKAMDGAAKGIERTEDVELQIGISRELLAVPFVGKDVPSRNSEFAHPEVLIGLTILAYRYEGLPLTFLGSLPLAPFPTVSPFVRRRRYEGLRQRDLSTIVRHLKNKVSAEKGPYAERPTAIVFSKWVANAGEALAKELKDAKDEYTTKRAKFRAREAIEGAELPDGDDGEEITVTILAGLKNKIVDLDFRGGQCQLLKERDLDKIHLHEDSQIKLLHDVLHKSPEVVVHYLRAHVFPRVMEHQHFKLQASGVDLGSDMLFGTRLGFSGTPSNLLPMELRPCHFEPGSEAQIVRASTDPNVMHVKEIRNWSVKSVIDEVRNGGYNALIDTGALITGYTNQEVCVEVLRDGGASHVDVAVFLNARDEKMVLDRYGAVYELSRCGVALKRRFTFYDQARSASHISLIAPHVSPCLPTPLHG